MPVTACTGVGRVRKVSYHNMTKGWHMWGLNLHADVLVRSSCCKDDIEGMSRIRHDVCVLACGFSGVGLE